MTQLPLAFRALTMKLNVVATDEETGLGKLVIEGLLIGQVDIVDEAAVIAVEVIMLFSAIVVAIGAVGDFDFENMARLGQHFEVAIHRPQTDVRNLFFHFMIHHISRWMRGISLKGFQNGAALSGHSHNARSIERVALGFKKLLTIGSHP